jgi:hypothetical protein
MLKKESCVRAVKAFRAKHGLDASDENVIATMHLMNKHGMDVNAALDQSSSCGNDHGSDAWYYDEPNRELFIYQSKLTESKALALRGLDDLDRARQWLEQVIIEGTVETVPSDNHCLFTLYRCLSEVRGNVRRIHFALVSPFDKSDLEDSPEYVSFERNTVKLNLNIFVGQRQNGRLIIDASEYDLEQGFLKQSRSIKFPKFLVPVSTLEKTLTSTCHM